MWFIYGLAILGGFCLAYVVVHAVAGAVRAVVKPAPVPDDVHHAFSDDEPQLRLVK